MYFYQSDIDEFKTKYEQRLCELIQQNPVNVQPAFDIYNRFLDRVKERGNMIQHILSQPIDFNVDEEYVIDKSKDFTLDESIVKAKGLQSFPRTPEAAYDRWRRRLKCELLELKADRISSERQRERAVAEGKEPPEVDERDPVERLQKRYNALLQRYRIVGRIDNPEIFESVRREANNVVLGLFLNSISEVLDPHSNYLPPSIQRAWDDDMRKSFVGIGALLSTDDDGYTLVKEVIKGGPADDSGELRAKDKIQGVGQGKEGKIEEVINFNITDVVNLIRGPKGTMVRLDVLPNGKGPSKIVELVRGDVKRDDTAVSSAIYEVGRKADGTSCKIGFIKLPDFYLDMEAVRRREPRPRSATTDTKEILKKFVAENVDAVVLDLRSNGGGALDEAVELLGLFIGEGVSVQTKDEVGSRARPMSHSDSSCAWTGPLVVVTNKRSASASEIVSGAIKDYRRGLIIGDSTSYGKGTVQQVIDLSNRWGTIGGGESFGMAKVTIRGFYRPSGITTQGLGVDADITLPSILDSLEGMTESAMDNVLVLEKIPAVAFTPNNYVSPRLIAELKRRSEQRVRESNGFAKELEKIAAIKDVRAKREKPIPLKEAKFLEESKRFDADEWEDEALEDTFINDQKIKRDFYVDEVLEITVDYLRVAQELGMAFPKERTVQPQPSRSLFRLFGG
ncbi:MAG: carboxy terminal-processing peptidase [Planctomycetaceae bacterium]|jgi:carboxyl-terminal processing protease|nr:carboxy terminal-processing peptidase [Planctomycetaceae bacterium]